MAQTRLFASWNEPLVPLTDKQLQAAADSLEYANAHELFLALETDDHLQYHHSVAADEQRRIPAVERSLAENHLPALVIPSTKVDELWTVPRRVASVLETVCRALDDDELKVCEEAVVNDGVGLAGSRRPAHLKIEPPLLHTDPDADCAELQRCGDAARSCGEECVRQHGISHNTSEEDDLFMIPRDAAEYAAQLEENIRTETMTVSEQAIRSLVSLMSSMEWTEKDQAVFWDEQLTVPKMLNRYLSPPLPPVDSFEYYIPEGDVCLVSDASDVSSRISEALEEAERSLVEYTNGTWKEESHNFDMAAFTHAPPLSLFDDVLPHLPEHHEKHRLHESDISSSPSPAPIIHISRNTSKSITEDNELFKNWIGDSVFEGKDFTKLPEQAVQAAACEPSKGCVYDNPAPHDDFQGDLSDDSCMSADFQDVTEEALLSFKESSIVSQAKLSVPHVGIEASPLEWQAAGEHPLDVFRWILHGHTTAVIPDEWPSTPGEHENERLFEAKLNALAKQCTDLVESMEIDEQSCGRAALWLRSYPDIHSILVASLKPVPLTRRAHMDLEEPLPMPKDKPKETLKEVPKPSPEAPQTAELKLQSRPQMSNNPWGDLMRRFKKRKIQHTPNSQIQGGSQTFPNMPQQPVQIKAPELLLGFRAFADPSIQSDNDGQGVRQDGNDSTSAKTTATFSSTIQNSLAVQPVDTLAAHLPKAILSTTVPRMVRSILLQLLPTLEFVERDYQQDHSRDTDMNSTDEADIVMSSSAGIIVTTMVGLRQTDTQRRFIFQARVAAVAQKYERLHLFIYRAHARSVSAVVASSDGLPELSPSDAMSLAQLQGFVRGLPCKVSVSYVGGGERTVAEWMASLILKVAENNGKTRATEGYLVEETTCEEAFLRQAGFNVYDAQIVLGVLQASAVKTCHGDKNWKACIRRLLAMSPDERLRLFSPHVGCSSVLARVNAVLSQGIQPGLADK